MNRIGQLKDFPALEAIADAINSKKMHFRLPDGTALRTKLFKGVLFAVDHEGVRYVEQNPKTSSAYAARARAGSRIIWVIKTHQKARDATTGRDYLVPCENHWLGRIEDGQVYKK